jgi:hypothetical protein
MPSERFTLDLSPRLPVCCPTHDSHAAGAGLRRTDRNPVVGVSNGLLWAATAYRSLQRMFDARARPRAVNPPPREAPASVRVCLHSRFPACEGSPGGCPPARPLPVAPTHCLRSLYRPDDLHHPLDTGERATSFSRYGCFHPLRVLPVWCEGGDRLRPGRARPGFTPAVS